MSAWGEFREALAGDIHRYRVLQKNPGLGPCLRLWLYTPGLWILVLYRFGRFLDRAGRRRAWVRPAAVAFHLVYFAAALLTGIDLPLDVEAGPGLYIGHWGGITVHPSTVLGRDCNISQGVTIGEGGRGRRGVPVIGDRVYIGPGAKIFGPITVGSDAAVGANTVVLEDVPDMAVVGGVPARILNDKGSKDFVIT